MPIPTPRKGDNQDKFLNRCMADNVMKNEYSNIKERYAVCLGEWKKAKK